MLADLRRFPEQYMLWRQAKSVIEEASDTRAVDSASPQPKAV
jgi:hypothetical protein